VVPPAERNDDPHRFGWPGLRVGRRKRNDCKRRDGEQATEHVVSLIWVVWQVCRAQCHSSMLAAAADNNTNGATDEVRAALDQGTTSSRAIVFDRSGRIVTSAQQEFRQIYPQPGWVEHDAAEIWSTQLSCAQAALRQAGIAARDIAGIGITNQRETTVLWDRLSARRFPCDRLAGPATADCARHCARAATRKPSPGRRDWCWIRTFPRPRLPGCSTMCRAPGHAPIAANWHSAPSTAG